MDDQIAGIILAAGGSTRFGETKQLADWNGKTLINHVIDIAITSQLDPIIVVLGSDYDSIYGNISLKNQVVICKNEEWSLGQSTSLKKGVDTLGRTDIPFIFLLCDQPQISSEIVIGIKDRYIKNKNDIVVMSVNGKLIPPILFNPKCISGIRELSGDRGGRYLIEKYNYGVFLQKDNNLLLDIDTKEDYVKIKDLYL